MRIKIPLVIGKNRLRGYAIGAMVDENDGIGHLDQLRSVLRAEAVAAGITLSSEWLSTAVTQMLKLYEQAHAAWNANKDGSVGHLYEACLPSGKTLLLGDARALAGVR